MNMSRIFSTKEDFLKTFRQRGVESFIAGKGGFFCLIIKPYFINTIFFVSENVSVVNLYKYIPADTRLPLL